MHSVDPVKKLLNHLLLAFCLLPLASVVGLAQIDEKVELPLTTNSPDARRLCWEGLEAAEDDNFTQAISSFEASIQKDNGLCQEQGPGEDRRCPGRTVSRQVTFS